MNRKIHYLIIAFLCLALAGIIAVQFMWIRNALKVRETQFNLSVNDALGNVVSRVEAAEKINLISQQLISDSIRELIETFAKDSLQMMKEQADLTLLKEAISEPLTEYETANEYYVSSRQNPTGNANINGLYLLSGNDIRDADSLSEHFRPKAMRQEEYLNIQFQWHRGELTRLDSLMRSQFYMMQRIPVESYTYYLSEFERQLENEYMDWERMNRQRALPPPPPPPPVKHNVIVIPDNPVRLKVTTRISTSRDEAAKILEDRLRRLNRRSKEMQELIRQMAIEFETLPKSVEARIDREMLQKSLISSLNDKDITLPFEFAVFNPQSDSNPVPIKSDGFDNNHLTGTHMVSLFPNDIIEKPEQLLVYFPDERSHIVKSLAVLMSGSLL